MFAMYNDILRSTVHTVRTYVTKLQMMFLYDDIIRYDVDVVVCDESVSHSDHDVTSQTSYIFQ